MRNLLMSFLILTGCVDATLGDSPVGDDELSGQNALENPSTPDEPTEPQSQMVSFQLAESDDDFLNPERGYYVGFKLVTEHAEAAQVRAGGHTIALTIVRLDAYRASSLDNAFLDKIRAGFAAVRAAGIKSILRFTYNSSGTDPDAPKARVLAHIAQVAPIIQENADVITVVQAGFIGSWGEWHGSTNNLDNDEDQRDILDALLAAVPAHRQIQVRTPMAKEGSFPGGALSADEAYDGSARARLGHHNDCFLASATDYGTYDSPAWEDFSATDGQYTAIGGETCKVYAPRSSCAAAVDIMKDGHWSYLNSEYHQDVLAGFEDGGCHEDINRGLGYRFTVVRAAHSERVAPGGILDVELEIKNTGFASPYNRRPVEVVLRQGDVRWIARLSGQDARAWKSGETVTLTARLRLPADAPIGAYELAVRLPDESSSLADRPAYAIRLANEGTWRSDHGDNVVSDAVLVEDGAPGARDLSATAFAEIE